MSQSVVNPRYLGKFYLQGTTILTTIALNNRRLFATRWPSVIETKKMLIGTIIWDMKNLQKKVGKYFYSQFSHRKILFYFLSWRYFHVFISILKDKKMYYTDIRSHKKKYHVLLWGNFPDIHCYTKVNFSALLQECILIGVILIKDAPPDGGLFKV